MTNVMAFYQTRLHQFGECLTNFTPLLGKRTDSFNQLIKYHPRRCDGETTD